MIFNLFQRNNPLKEIIAQGNFHIIDVREASEFAGSRLSGAINMPLSRFNEFIPDIQKMNGPIILHCQSGMRSGQATKRLKAKGITEVYNGGGIGKMRRLLSL
ncbi:MAG: rhodanese-like domain-containing protein [Bacteroidota bacterium]